MTKPRTMMTQAEEDFEEAMKQKALDDMEIIETGTGPAPKSRGRAYPHLSTGVATDQTSAKEADINRIMERHVKAGTLADLIAQGMHSVDGMLYGDFADPVDFQTGMNIVAHAKEQFMLLDAKVRDRFQNDPAEFLKFMHDPKNEKEQIQMGLRQEFKEPEPDLTNRDVVNAIKETAKRSKTKPPLGDPGEQ